MRALETILREPVVQLRATQELAICPLHSQFAVMLNEQTVHSRNRILEEGGDHRPALNDCRTVCETL